MQKDQRILLVEDDGGIVWALNEVLRGEGFEVCAVSGETEAKRYLEGGSLPDVILLDLSLADGNGFFAFLHGKGKIRRADDISYRFRRRGERVPRA